MASILKDSYPNFQSSMESSGYSLTVQDWLKRVFYRKDPSGKQKFNVRFFNPNKFCLNTGTLESWYNDHLSLKPQFDELIQPQSWVIMRDRYLEPLEYPSERFFLAALRLSQGKYENFGLILEALMTFKISLATPLLLNIAQKAGSTASCFITTVEDSLEGIMMDALPDCAVISKQGGGVGVNLSSIRAHGSTLRGVPGGASGVCPASKLFNDVAIFFNQGGKRAGAITLALGVWHRDIEDFLSLQTEHGDPRLKAYDIFPQVVIPDVFMECVEKNESWLLVDPRELSNYCIDLDDSTPEEFNKQYERVRDLHAQNKLTICKEVSAKELLKSILRTQVETGLPYIFFRDTVNNANQCTRTNIRCANLCMESFSPFSSTQQHVCSLVSLNFANFSSVQDVRKYTRVAYLILDSASSFTKLPTKRATNHSNYYNVFGIGVMGLADYFAKRGYRNYVNNPLAIEEAEEMVELMALTALQSSCQKASINGAAPFYESSYYAGGALVNRTYLSDPQYANSKYRAEWEQLRASIEKWGLANLQLLAIAPNSSTSLVMGSTPSIFPAYAEFYYDRGTSLNAISLRFPEFRDNYTFIGDVEPIDVVRFVARLQRWVDAGISMELMFDFNKPGVNAKTIYDTVFEAWKLKCKTIYYIRSNTNQSCDISKECSSCAN